MVVLIYISLITNEVKHLSLDLLVIQVPPVNASSYAVLTLLPVRFPIFSL